MQDFLSFVNQESNTQNIVQLLPYWTKSLKFRLFFMISFPFGFCAQNDPANEVRKLSKQAFEMAFPKFQNRINVLNFCFKDFLLYFQKHFEIDCFYYFKSKNY
ncbi:zinc finger protein [Anaeramoeba ignava]|uniref:Zinc finger protein n=1 Tax=Anaeramoeba ignava TaxID=1746090 RepID=A0A9Q0LF53_ANAIG|nr:zinc finger protein [Anaeramoeba ignava]